MRGQKVIDTWAAPRMKPAMAGPITVSRPDAQGKLQVVAVIPSPGDVEMPAPALRRALTIHHRQPLNDDLVSAANMAKKWKENSNGN